MAPEIKSIQVKPKYRISVKFKNGQARLFDVEPYLNKGIFKELKNPAYLKKVRIISGGIEWPHKQDLSADTLYFRGKRFLKNVA